MLRCNMNNTRLSLDDLIGDLVHARRQEDLGRLALLGYCEVRHWARWAGEKQLADRSSSLVTQVSTDRGAFLQSMDALIAELEDVSVRMDRAASTDPVARRA